MTPSKTAPFALVIEDHPDQLMVFSAALRQAGFTVEGIDSGQFASQRLRETTPTLVVLDLHIPGVSGETLLEQIKADPRLSATRVVLATADALLAEKLRPQVSIVLLKPISYTELIRLAERLRPH